jgi:hypothetical protein
MARRRGDCCALIQIGASRGHAPNPYGSIRTAAPSPDWNVLPGLSECSPFQAQCPWSSGKSAYEDPGTDRNLECKALQPR